MRGIAPRYQGVYSLDDRPKSAEQSKPPLWNQTWTLTCRITSEKFSGFWRTRAPRAVGEPLMLDCFNFRDQA